MIEEILIVLAPSVGRTAEGGRFRARCPWLGVRRVGNKGAVCELGTSSGGAGAVRAPERSNPRQAAERQSRPKETKATPCGLDTERDRRRAPRIRMWPTRYAGCEQAMSDQIWMRPTAWIDFFLETARVRLRRRDQTLHGSSALPNRFSLRPHCGSAAHVRAARHKGFSNHSAQCPHRM